MNQRPIAVIFGLSVIFGLFTAEAIHVTNHDVLTYSLNSILFFIVVFILFGLSILYALNNNLIKSLFFKDKRLSDLVNDLNVGLFVCRIKDKKIVKCNNSFARLLGYDDIDECISKASITFSSNELKGDSGRPFCSINRRIINIKRKDNSDIWLNCSVRPAKKGYIEGIAIDITETKRREEWLRKLSAAVEQSTCSIIITDRKGNIEYVNKKFTELTGYTLEEVSGKSSTVLEYCKSATDNYKELLRTINDGKEWIGELHSCKKNGEPFWEFASISPICDDNGNVTHFLAIKNDITESKKVQDKLKKLQNNLRLEKIKLERVLDIDRKMGEILDINHLVDFIVNKATEILEAERCSLMLVDTESKELLIRGSKGVDNKIIKEARIKIGQGIAGLVAKNGNPLLVTNIEGSQFKGNARYKNSYKTKSFISVPIKVHNKIVGVVNITDKKPDKDGRPRVFNKIDLKILCTIVRQASIAIENANFYRKLEYLSVKDEITGIFNHRFFIRSLDREIARAKRYLCPLSLMIIDINDFKSYNDRYGEQEGDKLLKSVAHILKKVSRNVDIVCRYAGDAFVIILPETSIVNAKKFAARITHAMEISSFKDKVTISIGLIQYSNNNESRIDFVMRAGQALIQAKSNEQNDENNGIVPF